VCKCGLLFHKFVDGDNADVPCECGLEYEISNRTVREKEFATQAAEKELELATA
jgi:hypothetical protein